MKKLLTLIALALLPIFFFLPNAAAHATITISDPTAGATISKIPSLVWIEFDGNLQTFEGHEVNTLKVTDSSGVRLDDGKYIVGGARLGVNISNQSTGLITMSYRVVSEDGHPVSGKIEFNSGNQRPQVLATSTPHAHSNSKSGSSSGSGSGSILGNHFLHHHAVHIFEVVGAIWAIWGWFLYRKFSQR